MSSRSLQKAIIHGVVATLTVGAFGAAQAQSGTHSFDIREQPVASAIAEYANRTGRKVNFPLDRVSGRRVEAIQGTFADADVLSQLAAAAGLVVLSDDGVTVTLGVATAGEAGTVVDANQPSRVLPSVVVTGTRLAAAQSTAVVQSLSREEIERAGLTTTDDIVRSLPQNYSGRNSGTAMTGQGSVSSTNPASLYGSASVDLRGMGEGSTLVLVNGRRLAASAAGGAAFVDVSTIPADAIERVDVLTGGASAVYGSDAVAGVVNFVLRRKFEGAETRVRASTNANGGGETMASQFVGTTWNSGQIMAGLNLSKVDPVDTSKILTTQDFRSRGGRDFRPSTISQPALFSSLSGTAIPGAGSATRVTFPANQPGTSLTMANAIDVSSDASVPRVETLTPTLTPTEKKASIYLTGEQELGSNVLFFADLLYSTRSATTLGAPATISNALMMPGLNPNNPFTVPVRVDYQLGRETQAGLIEAPSTDTHSSRLNATFGLNFELPAEWSGSTYLGIGQSRDRTTSRDIYQDDLNPTGTAAYAALNATDPARALNVFGDGSQQSPAALAGLIQDTAQNSYRNKLSSFTAQAEGPLFSLRGKPVRALIGAEVRRETLSFNDLFVSAAGAASLLPVQRTQRATAEYAEISIPVISADDAIPWVKGLTFSGALRRDSYGFDAEVAQSVKADLSHTSPALGMALAFNEHVTLLTNWSRSYKVPNLNDLFAPQLDVAVPFFPDPLSPSGLATNVHFVKGGNPNLKSQSGNTYAVALQYAAANDIKLSAAYTRIVYDDLITDPLTIFSLLEVLGNPGRFPGSTTRDASGKLLAVNDVPVNLSHRESDSLDLSARRSWKIASGRFDAGIDATRQLKLKTEVDPGSDPVSQVATTSGPAKWKMRLSGSYTSGPMSFTTSMNHETGYTNSDPSAIVKDVSGYTTVDVSGAYVFPVWKTLLSGGVRNLFNAAFPFVDNSFGFDARKVDIRGRQIYVALRKSF